MAFHDDLFRHAEAVKNRIPHIKGEEATKHALVVPFLQVLGYDGPVRAATCEPTVWWRRGAP